MSLLNLIIKYDKIEHIIKQFKSKSEKEYIYQQLWVLVLIFGLHPDFPNKNYIHLIKNKDNKLNQLKNIENYINNSENNSDIILQNKINKQLYVIINLYNYDNKKYIDEKIEKTKNIYSDFNNINYIFIIKNTTDKLLKNIDLLNLVNYKIYDELELGTFYNLLKNHNLKFESESELELELELESKSELELESKSESESESDLLVLSVKQTKKWRQTQKWYKNGKHNECEIYQRNLINSIIKTKCNKTSDRIFKVDNKIYSKKNPYNDEDGFEWTEDFDGKVIDNDKIYYFNLKFVCEVGGAQTRTLKGVYDFIKAQINFITDNKLDNIYFINILDGDTSYKYNDKYKYLINKNIHIEKYIYVGDLYNFENFWINRITI
jgi:hypothetical protein